MVSLPLTPHAHPLAFVELFWMNLNGVKLPDREATAKSWGLELSYVLFSR